MWSERNVVSPDTSLQGYRFLKTVVGSYEVLYPVMEFIAAITFHILLTLYIETMRLCDYCIELQ